MKYSLEGEKISQIHEVHLTDKRKELLKEDLVKTFGNEENITPEGIDEFANIVSREQIEIAEVLHMNPVSILCDVETLGDAQAAYNPELDIIYVSKSWTGYLLEQFSKQNTLYSASAEFMLMSNLSHEYYHRRQYLKFPSAVIKDRTNNPYWEQRVELGARLFTHYYLEAKLNQEMDLVLEVALTNVIDNNLEGIDHIANTRKSTKANERPLEAQEVIIQP